MTASHSPLPASIGPYPVRCELGRGGMGVVYGAHDPRLDRRIAVKVLSSVLSRDAEWQSRFTREAKLLAALNHPNIATIYSLEHDDAPGEDMLTMEWIEGQSLAQILDGETMTIPEALALGRQLARALEAAHQAGIIHRDLKPLSVMVTADAHVKVLDFGLATRSETSRLAERADHPEGRRLALETAPEGT